MLQNSARQLLQNRYQSDRPWRLTTPFAALAALDYHRRCLVYDEDHSGLVGAGLHRRFGQHP